MQIYKKRFMVLFSILAYIAKASRGCAQGGLPLTPSDDVAAVADQSFVSEGSLARTPSRDAESITAYAGHSIKPVC